MAVSDTGFGDCMQKLCIDSVDGVSDAVRRALKAFDAEHSPVFCDVRLDVDEGKGAYALNGNIKSAAEDVDCSLGVRVYAAAGGVVATGQAGETLGRENFWDAGKHGERLLGLALKRARRNAEQKAKAVKAFPSMGKSFWSTLLASVKEETAVIKPAFEGNPRDTALEELVARTEKCSTALRKMDGVAANETTMVTGLERQLYLNNLGADIDQGKAFTQSFAFVTAKGKAVETFYEWSGALAGTEVFEGKNPRGMLYEAFAGQLAEGTIALSNAPAVKSTDKPVTVITDPNFNALFVHEIIGHPCEADRALKKEAAWAGRAWWFRGLNDNEIGKPVASEHVNVFSDPGLEGYGRYDFDDEGVRGKRVQHIKDGELKGFLNSRETAAVLGDEPNGGMRASSAAQVPLIRMNNTCFDNGPYSKEELFEETREGFYVVGQKTPSIGETRQNFQITCWKLFEIRDGEIGTLYRMGGITGDSPTFLKSIEAAADDLQVYNIPVCGKGTPMQTMRVGNGGPHLKAKARVTGGSVQGGQQ